jgi:hypothetical protein
MWIVACLGGALVGLLSILAFPRSTSHSWPAAAAQILPTLLIALAIVDRLYPDPARARVGDPFSILVLSVTVAAEVVALAAAGADHSFGGGSAALVDAAIGALLLAVVSIPLVDPTKDRSAGDG